MRHWSCPYGDHYAPNMTIPRYLLGASAGSRLRREDASCCVPPGAAAKAMTNPGPQEGAEGQASAAGKRPALARLAHTRCSTMLGARLLSSTFSQGSHTPILCTSWTTPCC